MEARDGHSEIRLTTPREGAEDDAQRKERNAQDQVMAVRFILAWTGKSKTVITEKPSRGGRMEA